MISITTHEKTSPLERISMYVEKLKNEREWEMFLDSSLEGTFFHSLKWKEVMEKSFHYSSLYLTIRNENGVVVGICPMFILDSMHIKFCFSTPYSDYGGPVIAKDYVRQASWSLQSFLLNSFLSKNVAYAKICFIDRDLARLFEVPTSYVSEGKGIVEIDLETTPSHFIWNKLFTHHRRQRLRCVERDGFQAKEARTRADLIDFYSLYCKNMNNIGVAPYPYRFIENMWNMLYPEHLRIWLAEKGKRTGGLLVLKHGKRTYCVFEGLDKQRCRQYSIFPYLLWKEIEKAQEEGCSRVSLGGTPSDPNNPYFIQKKSFGGLFNQQEMIWYPLSARGYLLLQTRHTAVSAWKTIREFLPTSFKSILESKLSRI